MNILVCPWRVPYPLHFGDTLRIYNIFRLISKKNSVYLLYIDNEINRQLLEKIPAGIFSECIPLEFRDLSDFDILLNRKRPKVELFKEKIISIIDEYNIDVLHLQNGRISLMLNQFRKIPVVMDKADLDTLAIYREIKQSKILRKILLLKYFFITMMLEKRQLGSFHAATFVSEIDAHYARKLNKASYIKVITNGVNTNYFSPLPGIVPDDPSIIFFGNMDFPPNVDAATYIYNEIYPLVQASFPEVKFYIVGNNPLPQIMQYKSKKVIVTGFVEDIRSFVMRASVVVVPMRMGSGIKNKILEAMAMGKPVVANNNGVEALDEETKNCILLGDTPQQIAKIIIKLLDNEELRKDLGERARMCVLKNFQWIYAAWEYLELYRELINKGNYEDM